MFCCCRVISPHTVVVEFHLQVWWRILLYSIVRGDYDVFVASGATASEMKLVPHISRVGLDTLHALGWVIFVYLLDVNYVLVHLCAWWLVAIGEPYTCAIIVENNLCQCLFVKDEIINAWLIMFIFLIMIDVKLTPSGLWWTAYLFVWMSRRRVGLVGSIALVSA